MLRSAEEVYKLTESTYKVGTGVNTTGATTTGFKKKQKTSVCQQLKQLALNFSSDFYRLIQGLEMFLFTLVLFGLSGDLNIQLLTCQY